MRLPLTLHACRRMRERDITAPMVAAVLLSGSSEPAAGDGAVCYRLCGLRVLVSIEHRTIITVCASRPHPAKPGPKRLARMPGQERRRHEREARRSGSKGW